MEETYIKLYDYCTRELKIGEILDYINVKY